MMEDRLPPVRGLVLTQNRKGKLFPQTALKQWINQSQVGFKAEKVDILVDALPLPRLLDLLDYCQEGNLPVSPRCMGPLDTATARALRDREILDVFLAPAQWTLQQLRENLAACRDTGLKARLQFTGVQDLAVLEALPGLLDPEWVTAVNVAPFDPFLPQRKFAGASSAAEGIASLVELARTVKQTGVEANLLRIPFCQAPRDIWPEVLTLYQLHLHHQQYLYEALDLAQTLFECSPPRMAAGIENYLFTRANLYRIIDPIAFPRILSHPGLHMKLWLLNKLRRKWPRKIRPGMPVPESAEAFEAALAEVDLIAKQAMGPACAACTLRKICDHAAPPLRAVFPGVTLTPQQEEGVVSPMHFNREQRRALDAVDQARAEWPAECTSLEAEGRAIVDGVAPTKVFGYDEYDIEGHWTDRLIGAVRWWSLTTDPMRSTPLARVELPFTIGCTFGGGMADHVGFSFGDHIHLVCPMVSPTHHVALHVRRDGRYVLLRDGKAVRPTEFTGVFRVPERLGTVLHPQLSVWNVDGHIQTQSPQLWLNSERREEDLSHIVHSVIVPSTRYSRRLQALILGIAHQQHYDLRRIEVIVSYVPGLDSNDDVLDSIEAAFPQLRIVRCTFTERHARSRGLMVNEALRMASGQWVTLFDSDIVVPGDFYARLDAVPEGTRFVAPDGRKMLPPDITAQILLGERRPWEEFQAFLDGPGELWHREAQGVPVGFCQIVRREILQELPYAMVDHFEGSDWDFSQRVMARYGKEHRLEGCYVLHLDHGGSQWYGARKQK
jgi:hypothetical protein